MDRMRLFASGNSFDVSPATACPQPPLAVLAFEQGIVVRFRRVRVTLRC
ncbi:MAG: hypothetical protein H0W24_11965 [Lysobacter sp.]|nr:hypothetical protein [Lysobacter sp.]